jgi:hypothetical protein
MPISYPPLMLIIKDIENNKLSPYNGETFKKQSKTNDKKEKINLKKNFSFDDFFKIHLY